MENQYPSLLLERAVNEFSRLPGIGRKTALRLVLNLLRQDVEEVERFTDAVLQLRKEVRRCRICHNISDTEICPICSDSHRNRRLICVVENIQDVMAVERTGQFYGLYHVLGEIIPKVNQYFYEIRRYSSLILIVLLVSGALSRPLGYANHVILNGMWKLVKMILQIGITGTTDIYI